MEADGASGQMVHRPLGRNATSCAPRDLGASIEKTVRYAWPGQACRHYLPGLWLSISSPALWGQYLLISKINTTYLTGTRNNTAR